MAMTAAGATPFDDHARRTPDAVAIDGASGPITYADLGATVRRCARLMQDNGVTTGEPVAVLSSDASRYFSWLVALLRCGACAVPVEPTDPAERVRDLLGAVRPRLVLTDPGTATLAPGLSTFDITTAADPAPGPMPPAVHADVPAYVCFTSGTTGRPKAVVVPHRALRHTAAALADCFGLGHSPRTHLLTTSWAFDVAVTEAWLAVATGGRLLVPERTKLLGRALATQVSGQERALVQATPSRFASIPEDALDSLGRDTIVVLGGEPATESLLTRLADRTDLHVTYGVTEAGACATMRRVTPGTVRPATGIGAPLPGVRAVVTEPDGELYLGGPGLALGYLDDPERTAERFVRVDGELLYRTGDLVRSGAGDELVYGGRVDEQLNLRGYRIEPAELEPVLESCPGVDRAAVAVVDGELTAFLAGTAIDREAVRATVDSRLPTWMRPTRLHVDTRIPLTATGKIDRGSLQRHPAADEPRTRDGTADAVPAGDDVLEALAEIWRQVLGVERLTADDNFVKLGGHSITAMQVVVRVQERLRRRVALDQLFETPVLRDLAEVVSRIEPEEADG